jgi:hypothetical protein
MLKKILLGLSLAGFTIGLSGFGKAPQWSLALPLGVVSLAMLFIVVVLEKASAEYDEEESRKPAAIDGARPARLVERGHGSFGKARPVHSH